MVFIDTNPSTRHAWRSRHVYRTVFLPYTQTKPLLCQNSPTTTFRRTGTRFSLFSTFSTKTTRCCGAAPFVWQQNHLISCRVLSSCWFRAALVLLSDIFRLLGCSLRVCCVKFAVILRVKQTYTPVHANKEDSRIIELVLRKFFFRFFRFSQKTRGCNR